MKEFATWALDTAVSRGATYAEVRVLDTRQRYISTKNGRTSQVRDSQSLGLGIRVI
jgi:predicted Zn-dependent protease